MMGRGEAAEGIHPDLTGSTTSPSRDGGLGESLKWEIWNWNCGM